MLITKKNTLILPITSLIFLSLTTSKAILNISLFVFFILGSVVFTKKAYSITNKDNSSLILLPIILFSLGLIFSLPHNNEDFLYFLSKGAFLLTLPLINYSLSNKKTRSYCLSFLFVGIIIATTFSLYKLFSLSIYIGIGPAISSRIASFWDIGRWGEILTYSLCILIPYTKNISSNKKLLFILITTLSLVCIFASGSRAAFLSLFISLSIYSILKKPKLLLALALAFTLVIVPSKKFDLASPILTRITSITDIQKNTSNLARLAMWREGYDSLTSKVSNESLEFFIGSGLASYEDKFKKFESDKYNNKNIFSDIPFSYTDNHNTYLELANKLGVIYLILYLYFLYSFAKFFIKNIKYNQTWACAGIGLILNHLVIGMFYTSGLSYQTIVLFYLLYLCYSYVAHSKSEQIAHVKS